MLSDYIEDRILAIEPFRKACRSGREPYTLRVRDLLPDIAPELPRTGHASSTPLAAELMRTGLSFYIRHLALWARVPGDA